MSELHQVNIMLQIWPTGSHSPENTPFLFPMALHVDESVRSAQNVVDWAQAKLTEIAERKDARLVFADDRGNYHNIWLGEGTVISILAPDPESFPWSKTDGVDDDG